MTVTPRVALVHDGRTVATYERHDLDRPLAEGLVASVALDELVPAVLASMPGWYVVSADDQVTDALLDAGATVARHAHAMTWSLGDRPAPALRTHVAGVVLEPLHRSAADLAELSMHAYAPGHPDHEVDPAPVQQELDDLLAGRLVGPLLPAASAVVLDGRRLVAASLVNRMPGDPPFGGPWLSNVFRHPDPRYRGVGAVLITYALAALEEAGEPALGLAVTDGNPAMAVYRRLGFELALSRRRVLLPSP